MNRKSTEYDKYGNEVFRAFKNMECAVCTIPIRKGQKIKFVNGKAVHKHCWEDYSDDHTEDCFSIF